MATTAVDKFLLSLAYAVASATSPALEIAANAGRAMWVHNAIEGQTTATYTVLRIYPGGTDDGAFANARVLAVNVQADTRGADAEAVLLQAWAVHEALKDNQGRPQMHWQIAGKQFNAGTGAIEADADGGWEVRTVRFRGTPGVIGRDEEQRSIATANYQIEFKRAA